MVDLENVDAEDAPSRGGDAGIGEDRLGNGLRIVVIPDHRSASLTHMVWYLNGSADDPPGKSGIAHFLEHLMFKGTAAHPAGVFSALLSAVGGEENAFTSHDFTAYFQRVPSSHLRLCMEYEADRMKNLVFADEVVGPERDVVLEERRMRVDCSPGEILAEALHATLFASHPYGKPVIGWTHEIEALRRQDAFAYYERCYSPENAILVVAGDVDARETFDLAAEIYGPIRPLVEAPIRRRPTEPPPTTHRLVTLSDHKVAQPVYRRMHLVPSYRTAAPGQAEALEVLAVLLGSGQTSVLVDALVNREGIAVSAGADYIGNALAETSFGFYAVPAQGVPLMRLEEAIERLVRDLSRSGFDPDDIARAKTRLVADAVYARDNAFTLAHIYGASLANGASLDDVREWPDRIDAVDDRALREALRLLDLRRGVTGRLEQAVAA